MWHLTEGRIITRPWLQPCNPCLLQNCTGIESMGKLRSEVCIIGKELYKSIDVEILGGNRELELIMIFPTSASAFVALKDRFNLGSIGHRLLALIGYSQAWPVSYLPASSHFMIAFTLSFFLEYCHYPISSNPCYHTMFSIVSWRAERQVCSLVLSYLTHTEPAPSQLLSARRPHAQQIATGTDNH